MIPSVGIVRVSGIIWNVCVAETSYGRCKDKLIDPSVSMGLG